MNLLYSEADNEAIDANGTEELTAASNPHWFAGTGSELARGGANIGIHAQRVAGQMDSSAADALGVNQYITPQGQVKRITEIEPTAPEDLPKFQKPDAVNSGAAAVFLGDLVQQAPAIAMSAVNPLAGFAAGASMGGDEGLQEAQEKGLVGSAAQQYAGLKALEDGIGAALPGIGGIGERAVLKYGSRFVVGGGVNLAQSAAFQWGRAEVLDAHGFHAQAEQLRQFDGQQAAATFVLGGFFNLAGGHARDRDMPVLESPEAQPLVNGPAPAPEMAPLQEVTPVTDPASTPLAGYKLSRADVKAAKSDLVNSQRHLDRLDAERAAALADAPKGGGKKLAQAREAQQARLAEIEAQRRASLDINNAAAERLASHEAYGRQRIEALHADAATHTVLHDNYVTESAPGLAVDVASEAAHVRAMDATADALHAGRPVDVSEHFSGDHAFLMRDDVAAGQEARQPFIDNTSDKVDATVRAAAENSVPEAGATPPAPGVISDTIPQPFENLRQQVQAMRETHPELADAIAPHIDRLEAEHKAASIDAQQYEIAAACALVHGA